VSDEQALVTVKDDGIGIDPARLEAGLGMRRSIVGRMEGIDGTAAFTSTPGRGMLVTLRRLRADSDSAGTAFAA
jgi:signal transduction histidine kinase